MFSSKERKEFFHSFRLRWTTKSRDETIYRDYLELAHTHTHTHTLTHKHTHTHTHSHPPTHIHTLTHPKPGQAFPAPTPSILSWVFVIDLARQMRKFPWFIVKIYLAYFSISLSLIFFPLKFVVAVSENLDHLKRRNMSPKLLSFLQLLWLIIQRILNLSSLQLTNSYL